MPEFSSGSQKVATVKLTTKPAGLQCFAKLSLVKDSITRATSGAIPFVSTGSQQSLQLPITMPTVFDTYKVWLDIETGGFLIGAYQGIEDVNIVPAYPPAAFTFSDVSAQMVICTGATAWMTMNFDCRITNPTTQTLTRTLTPMYRYIYTSGPSGPFPITGKKFLLTLTPGQNYSYHFEGNYYDPSDGQWYAWLIIGRYTTCCMWLEDEYGNKSPEVCVHRG